MTTVTQRSTCRHLSLTPTLPTNRQTHQTSRNTEVRRQKPEIAAATRHSTKRHAVLIYTTYHFQIILQLLHDAKDMILLCERTLNIRRPNGYRNVV